MRVQHRIQIILQEICCWFYFYNQNSERLEAFNDGADTQLLHESFHSELEEGQLAAARIWLSRRLQKAPYWSKGHLRFAHCAYRLNSIEEAHASSQAVLQLSSNSDTVAKAKHMLGKCYLRSHEFLKAASILEQLQSDLRNTLLREDLAAAYMALERHDDAYQLLVSIPQRTLSPQGMSALEFLRTRISEH